MARIPPETLRHAFGHMPTGVAVLCAYDADGTPVGMAANSVTSVSLDPPLLLFCPAKTSTTWPHLRAAGAFSVSILAAHQHELSRLFSARNIDRFSGIGWHPRDTGPGLDEAIAWIGAAIRDEHDAGDHTIVVADVSAVETMADSRPLVFFRGGYGGFAATTIKEKSA
jgi:3-hydroxy-9,10-secoandrosta-1,3,5(10)-triene-9,17-dione monooxygenase reductase component